MAGHQYRFFAFLFLVLCLQDVVASPYKGVRRDESTSTDTATLTSSSETGTTSTPTSTSPSQTDATPTITSTTSHVTKSTPSSSSTPTPSSTYGGLIVPTATVLPGHLPLKPELTPAWGVAGAIFLITGPIYAVVGIQNAWVHTYISSALLVGLSITVLIVYVMNPPISNAIQGAYLVAAVVSGLILGGGATVFREITEGFGCLLGGFCFAMWLLCLKAGGLVTAEAPKVVLIAAFTVGVYAFYFSRYTRPYALMGSMSFAGATVTVLGIDCFSRAGLKEFWAYIWNLNGKLFPYGVDTYPLTRGIQVELAATFVLTAVGIVSQLKLWRVISQRRERKAEEEADVQRRRDEEETRVGRMLEAQVGRERVRWENIYRDRQPGPESTTGSGESDFENEKGQENLRVSRTVARQVSSDTEEIELAELPSPKIIVSSHPLREHMRPIVATQPEENAATNRPERDDGHSEAKSPDIAPEVKEMIWIVGNDDEVRPISSVSARSSKRVSTQPGAKNTPLPYKTPNNIDEADSRSFVVAHVGEEEQSIKHNKRSSMLSKAKRMSVGSGILLQGISEKSKRMTKDFDSPAQSPKWTSSTEELVSEPPRHDSDAHSVAATIDGMSQCGDAHSVTSLNFDEQHVAGSSADISDDVAKHESTTDARTDNVALPKPSKYGIHLDVRPSSLAESVGTDVLDQPTSPALNGPPSNLSRRSSTNHDADKSDTLNDNSNHTDISAIDAASDSSRPPRSATTSMASAAVSLTKDRLPSSLSRAALSYRTNEWAKHLSAADALPAEHSSLDTYPEQTKKEGREAAAPVNVEELQRTHENGIPATNITRSSSATSNKERIHTPPRAVSRTPSYTSPKTQVPSTLAILTSGDQVSASRAQPMRTSPPVPSVGASQNLRAKGRRASEAQIQPIMEETADDHILRQQGRLEACGKTSQESHPPTAEGPQSTNRVPIPGITSHSTPQSAAGKRDMIYRSQSQLFSTPPIHEHPQVASSMPLSQAPQPYYSPAPAPSPYMTLDSDDIPLSQRKQLMRQNSMLSVHSNAPRPLPRQRSSTQSLAAPARYSSTPNLNLAAGGILAGEPTDPLGRFNSHQPQRVAVLPSQAQRDARLSSFRQSVAADLGHGASGPMMPVYGGGFGNINVNPNVDVTRTMEQQRVAMLSQKDQEAAMREAQRWEKDRNDRVFEEMMRSGTLVEAHRDALSRMQRSVKH